VARVLVTGAGSFTARHLIPPLAADPRVTEVWGTDRVAQAPASIRWVPADLEDAAAVRALVRAARPHRVIHLAGVASPDADRCFAVNLAATRRLLEACAEAPDCPAVLLVSSAAVYGLTRPEESPLAETTPLRPITAYGASKAAAEIAALTLHRRGVLPVTVARPFNLVGPGLRAGLAPADFVAQARAIRDGRAEAVLRVGDLTPRRDFVDVRDVARAYVDLLFHDDLRGRAFNVATGRAVPIRTLLELTLAAAGVRAEIATDPARLRPVEVIEQAGDPAALRAAVGWEAEVPLERSLRDML
jgi:GDP-4-dehydro-6-deoxy-D-mannose reductase